MPIRAQIKCRRHRKRQTEMEKRRDRIASRHGTCIIKGRQEPRHREQQCGRRGPEKSILERQLPRRLTAENLFRATVDVRDPQADVLQRFQNQFLLDLM